MLCNAMSSSELIMEDQPSAVGFTCRYLHGCITQADFRYKEHTATLYDSTGASRSFQWEPKIQMDVYTQVYGVGISPDGKFLFVPSWEKGIYCLSSEDGRLIWHYKRRHARCVYCYEDHITCFFEGDGLRRLSYDGDEQQRLSFTSGDDCWMLSDGLIFIGPKRNRYYLLHPDTFAIRDEFPAINVTGTEEDPYLVFDVTGTREHITLNVWHNDEKTTRELFPNKSGNEVFP